MSKNTGSNVWFVPDAYYPTISNGHFPSHEAICVLNPGDKNAEIDIILYFEDRDKMSGFKAICKAERTNHIRMDKLTDVNGNNVPKGVPYAMMIVSSEKVIIQYSRMDTTQAEMALMTTMAYPL